LSAPHSRSGRFALTGLRVLQPTRYSDYTTPPHLPTTLYTKFVTGSFREITQQTVIVAASHSGPTAAAAGSVTAYVGKRNNTPLQQRMIL